MEFFHLIKATQKSGKPDAVHWQTHKSEARANLALDVALEDAEIETGRGNDYNKPVRTDFPVFNDLPEEGAVDFEWCKRYELAEDACTWYPIARVVNDSEPVASAPLDTNAEPPAPAADASVSVENRSPAVRFVIHLMNDKYQTHISKDQQVAASESALEEGNSYLHNLLLARTDVADIGNLSMHAEWKLVQAVKAVFSKDEEHSPSAITAFMNAWVAAEAAEQSQLVEDWLSGKLPGGNEGAVNGDGRTNSELNERAFSHSQLTFEKRVFGTWLFGLFDELTPEQSSDASRIELDMDAHYAQNIMLASRNVRQLAHVFPETIADLFSATKSVWPVNGKTPLLNDVITFFSEWIDTHSSGKESRDDVTAKWQKKFKSSMVRTDSGTNADGGHVTDRGEDAHHTLDTLDLEIACALLPMDFNHFEIPSSVLRRAKEIVTKKEEPWKSWSGILRNQPGVLAVNRTAIFNLVRVAPENVHLTPAAHLEFVNRTMTAEFNAAVDLLPLPEATPTPVINATTEIDKAPRKSFCTHEENLQRVREEGARQRAEEAVKQPQVANLGAGVFSIEGLMNEKPTETDDRSSVNEETTSNVQMEKNNLDEITHSSPLPESPKETGAGESDFNVDRASTALSPDVVVDNADASCTLYSHLMLDLETMGNKALAPIVSIGAVFFDPATGETGGEFYQVVSLESSMYFGAKPDAGTILWWLKQSPEARSAILVDDAIGLVEALENFDGFIAENAANGSESVQLWGNGSSFDCTILESAFELADTYFPIKHWNYRDVRTVVELGKAVGLNARYDIPFAGDRHNALDDARHQVKYVSAIWQRLTSN
ncbi:3'-5' exoribonuclease [Lelliottia amnigena]|uniref:3'-5' exoribonuclease n=1 Tax=Lelliottia amnigena TaxID=61646 RepID=A0AAP2AER8_LELAM|nr:exonuclease [Lelliottia amnigena]MBL5899777.1 3'-5' exoribonuclease [Lelliottia amnigena]MBL5935291.1 3'-5' exoribonuclease [Lelliottia amnigena]